MRTRERRDLKAETGWSILQNRDTLFSRGNVILMLAGKNKTALKTTRQLSQHVGEKILRNLNIFQDKDKINFSVWLGRYGNRSD